MKIVFFDSEPKAELFIKSHAPKSWKIIFKNESLHDAKQSKGLEKVDVVSGFVWSIFDSKTLAKFKNLKAIATRSTGLDHIDLDYCKKNKIKILSVPHYGTTTVAEFTFTLLLALIRKLADGKEMLSESRIQQCELCGNDLAGKTIGIIGLGDIGNRVAKIANGFGMKVLGHDPFLKKKLGVKLVKLNTLLKNSDVISLHCPATEKTKNLLDFSSFELMKKGAIIINTARGQLIETKALYDAILNKKISGAGLDVANEEYFLFSNPTLNDIEKLTKEELEIAFLNQKLLQMEEVIITPHMAFNTKEAQTKILKTTIENIRKL